MITTRPRAGIIVRSREFQRRMECDWVHVLYEPADPALAPTRSVSAVLMIHGEKSPLLLFYQGRLRGYDAGKPLYDNKHLMLIPGAVHTDLYDRTDVIPFDAITECFPQGTGRRRLQEGEDCMIVLENQSFDEERALYGKRRDRGTGLPF